MLRDLSIRNMLLIDRLDLEFQPGLNVLTGETGAGKSILIDSLGFVLGWRGRADLVRTGADQGEVSAVFELPKDHPAFVILEDAGLPCEDALFLRRTNTPDGRKSAYINDRRCSGEILRQISETLVELHGQQDDKGLLNPRVHRDLLDSFANISTDKLRGLWRGWSAAKAEYSNAKETLEKAQADADYLRHALDELSALNPKAGEDAELDQRRRLMQAAEKIREDIAKAGAALSLDGAEGMVNDAARWLGDTADAAEGRLEAVITALARITEDLAHAQTGIADCLDALTFDPSELEETEERLFAIRALARKHNVQSDALEALTAEFATKVAAIDTGADTLTALDEKVVEAKQAFEAEALRLSSHRQRAAKTLAKDMAAELPPLKMERAEFSVELTPSEPGPSGQDAVQFMVCTNPGAPAGPINKIASGGELSRFLLALKVCLTRGQSGLTLIFDEIDRGVGGATADAVGRRLAELSSKDQVLVVTHSPQVAAKGAHQWRVSKAVENGVTLSRVDPLGASDRVDEIARMLAGDHITKEARAAAASLLKD